MDNQGFSLLWLMTKIGSNPLDMDKIITNKSVSALCSRESSPTFSYFSISSTASSNKVKFMESTLQRKASLLMTIERDPRPELTKQDVEFLTENTNFTKDEITQWFVQFILDCPEGTLTMEKLKEMMNIILPDENIDIIANLIFSAFDKDNNGSLDFSEFIMATHCIGSSSPEDKIRWVFQVYDTDNSGSITIGEIIQVFSALYENEGLDQKYAVERAETIFGNLDVNHDGDVSEDEFVKVCLEDKEMVKLLMEN